MPNMVTMGLALFATIYMAGAIAFYLVMAVTAQPEPMTVAHLHLVENESHESERRAA